MDPWEHLKAVLKDGDIEAIKAYCKGSEAIQFLRTVSHPEKFDVLRNNLEPFMDLCEVIAGRNEDIFKSHKFFDTLGKITGELEKGYRKLLDILDNLSEHPNIWKCTIVLYKLTLHTGSPALADMFHCIFTDDTKTLWKLLTVGERIEFCQVLLEALPKVVVKVPKNAKRNDLGAGWNTLVYTAFEEILVTFNEQTLNAEFLPILIQITAYSAEKILELDFKDDEMSTYHLIYISVTTQVCFKNVDLCIELMPVFEKVKAAGFATNNALILITNNCMKAAMEKKGLADSDSVQQQIDVFLEECATDQTSPIPDLLCKSYSQRPELIHGNLPMLVSKMKVMPVQHAMKVCELVKYVAMHNPQVIDENILSQLYPLLSIQYLTYYTMEALSSVSRVYPSLLDVSSICQFAVNNSVYMHTVCEILTYIGVHKSTSQKTASMIIEWLLTQCLNPINFSHRTSMLNAAKTIGLLFRNSLMQFKPLILTLDADPILKGVTTAILDFLEGRSLLSVDKRLDEQADVILEVADDVAAVDERTGNVEQTVKEHAKQIDVVSERIEGVKEEVTLVRAELVEAIIDIERIERETVNTTPKWCQRVADLMNPESANDWTLMAKRLGFTNVDLKSWATHGDPCMGVLTEFYATHKSSEATRAVYVVLKELGREDAAVIVADALEMAGEMVPIDEPLDINDPPAVFISYQWGIQDKAKQLKDYLTDAGFSCWLDIGQMGGGDKLYEKIDNGIRLAKVVVNLVTEKYAKSPNCNKEVNLSVSLHKPMFPLLMEKMDWPPKGSMGPLFSEYLFVRFYQRQDEDSKTGNFWPEAKMEELLIQLTHVVKLDEKLVTKEMDDWWLARTRNRVIGSSKSVNKSATSPEIFISYQWGKQSEVTELYKRLTSLGFSCWLDVEQMGAGDSLFDKIDEGVRSCKVVLACISQKYTLSLNCRREISLAGNLNKTIIPLLLEDIAWPPAGPMGMHLTQLLYLDFTKQQSLITGDSFLILLVVLSQYGIVKQGKVSKAVSSLATSVQAYEKFKRLPKARADVSPRAETSRACSIL